jgi:hypothetical protein
MELIMSFIGQSGEFHKTTMSAEIGQRHEIFFNIAVRDGDVLWCAAAQQLAGFGLGQDEIEACIGPRADACVEDCLRTLLAPFELAGCAVQDVAVAAKPDLLGGFWGKELKALVAELVESAEASALNLERGAKMGVSSR